MTERAGPGPWCSSVDCRDCRAAVQVSEANVRDTMTINNVRYYCRYNIDILAFLLVRHCGCIREKVKKNLQDCDR